MSAATKSTFWMVWNPDQGQPTHRHDSRGSAEREAERLARKYPGERFIVLRSVCERVFDAMQRVEHAEPTDGADLPF